MIDLKGYEYRIYPTEEQKIFFEKSFGCVRVIKNKLLEYSETRWKEDKSSTSENGFNNYIRDLKNEPEYIWLKEVSAQSLQQAAKDRYQGFVRFFKKTSKYPKFKSKKDKQSFRIPQKFSLDRDYNAALNILHEGLRQLFKLNRITEEEYQKYLGLGNTVPQNSEVLHQKLGEALSADLLEGEVSSISKKVKTSRRAKKPKNIT